MRAIVQESFGGPEVLAVAEVPRPEPLPTEVLVRVEAAGVNPVDCKTRAGRGMARVLGDPPFTVGWDVAGVVEEVGFGVTRFAVGDRVYGMTWFPRQAAAYADYVTAPSRQLARAPDSLGPLEAGAMPLAALTAWQALVDTAGVGAGDRVLVHGAAGGVGHIAVQIAHARGAYVLGTARAERHELLAELGLDEAIDYTETPFEQAAGEVDVVLDLVGSAEDGVRALRCLRPGGLLIAVPSGSDPAVHEAAEQAGRRVTGILVEPDGAALEPLARLVDDGQLRIVVQEAFPLVRAADAHVVAERGGVVGKLVLDVRR